MREGREVPLEGVWGGIALDPCLACTRSWDHFPTIQPNELLANGREDNEWERWGAGAGVWRGRYQYQPPPHQQEDSWMPSRTDCIPIQPHLSC